MTKPKPVPTLDLGKIVNLDDDPAFAPAPDRRPSHTANDVQALIQPHFVQTIGSAEDQPPPLEARAQPQPTPTADTADQQPSPAAPMHIASRPPETPLAPATAPAERTHKLTINLRIPIHEALRRLANDLKSSPDPADREQGAVAIIILKALKEYGKDKYNSFGITEADLVDNRGSWLKSISRDRAQQ